MVNPSQAQPRRTRRRWIVGGLVAAALLSLLAYFLVGPRVQTAVLKAQLSTEIPAARASAVPAADTAHAAWLERVSAALGLSRPAVYSASYDLCYEDSDGEFAGGYNEKCQVSYVDFYVLPGRNGAVETAIEEARTSQFGPESSAMVFVPGFLVDMNRTEEEPEDLPDTIWASMPGTSDARAASDHWTVTSSVPAYAAHDAFLGRTLLNEQGSTALDPSKQYIVIPDAHPYFAKVLGCSIGLRLFCTSPLAN